MKNIRYLQLLDEIARHDIDYIDNISYESERKKVSWKYNRIYQSFINPFSIVLFVIAMISLLLDLFKITNEHQYTTIPILIMLLIGGVVRYVQEQQSLFRFEQLSDKNEETITVSRNQEVMTVFVKDVQKGDVVCLHQGDYIPGDLRIISCQDLYVSQATLTGESQLMKKEAGIVQEQMPYFYYPNIVYMGSQIISGQLTGMVFANRNSSLYAQSFYSIDKSVKNYHYGFYDITYVFVKMICILIPFVFVFSSLDHNTVTALLFSLSIVIGLIPEMLPMIINLCFVAGSYYMEKRKSIVKNINAMEKFGSMDILCVDKTGTLTQNQIVLEYYLDVLGHESQKTLIFGLLNSHFLKHQNHLDQSILQYEKIEKYHQQIKQYHLIDTLPFDYSRKFASVLVENDKQLLIVKGSVDEVFARCRFVEYQGEIIPVDHNDHSGMTAVIDEMSEDGMKVLAVAYKFCHQKHVALSSENDLILIGYLVFFDSPKTSAKSALMKLKELNIQNKVLTGENLKTTLSVCKRLGFDTAKYITGHQLTYVSEDELPFIIEETHIFAELTPYQKGQIIHQLQNNGHTVGFLGDGMNDLSAVVAADVGISVENATAYTKEASDVILLEKDLQILSDGVLEGRKSFANMAKYIKITASSNFGNIFSIALASAFLPFVPMTAIQILLLNLFYDCLCVLLPFDHVDKHILAKPQFFSKKQLGKFIVYFGLMSSLFDIITFLFLFFVLCPYLCHGFYGSLDAATQKDFVLLFQTGWFLESIWSEICILWLLRTDSKPFFESQPSKIFFFGSLLGIVLLTGVIFTPLSHLFTLTILPLWYLLFIMAIVIAYMFVATLLKTYYIKKYKNWL